MFKHSRLSKITINSVMFLSLLLGSVLTATPVYAAGITVNTTADENNSGTNCSLREAITAANTDAAYGGCTAGSSADVITLPAGTYTLTIAGGNEDANATGDLDITSDLTINGAGAGNTIIQAGTIGYPNFSPNGIDRVIDILGIRSISISNVTIANGNCLLPDTVCYGGGIHIESTSTVVITDSNFSGNDADQGGGIYNRGGLTVINNIFSSNAASGGPNGHGGAIINLPPGTLDVTNSTFSSNVATGVGGAIHLNNALTVTGSTFLGNTAGSRGGAISIYNGGTHSITNSTFADNTAMNEGGGIYNYNGTLSVTNSTFSGNGATIGGGISNNNDGILHLKNTLLANSVSSVDCYNVGGDTIATNTNNLIEANGASGHMCGTPSVSADPALGPLTGSPAYFPLTGNSAAINAGDDAICAATPVNNNSQNGVARPQGAHCDIGSFELDPSLPVVTSILRANPNLTALSSVDFTVTFSEVVTGVNTSDFALTATGVSAVSVSGVSGSGSSYTVTVDTGVGSGTLRLDLIDDDSIQDSSFTPLGGSGVGNGSFITGQSYTINKSPIFGDAPYSYWANSFIERLYDAGITGGCSVSPLNYCPENLVTRDQMAIFLERGIQGPSFVPPNVVLTFGDTAGNFAEDWIEALKNDGITGGCGNGNYCPTQGVTRAQMAIFLERSMHGSSFVPPNAAPTFGDTVGNFAEDWIEALKNDAITSGCGNGNYCPDDIVTRAQMAVFLVKAFSLP